MTGVQTCALPIFAVHEIICDPAGKPVDYRFLAVNPAFERLTGLQSADIIGKTLLGALPDSETYWIETYGRVALTGDSIHFEQYSGALDKYFEVSAFCCSPGQFVCVFHDVTPTRRALEALGESERRFRSYVENASDIIFSISPEGTTTYISPNWLQSVGMPTEEGIGLPFDHFVHPDDTERCRSCLRDILSGSQSSGEVEYRIRHRDGSWRWHASRGSALRDSSGTIVGGIGIARDITETRQLQTMLQEERDIAIRLAQTDRLDEALEICATAAARVPDMDAAGIYLIDEETGGFELKFTVGISKEFAEKASVYPADSDQARLIMKGSPIHCSYAEIPVERPTSDSIRSISIAPLRYRDRIIGSLNVASHTATVVSKYAQDMVEMLAALVGDALGRLQDATRLDESRRRLALAAESAQLGIWDWDIIRNRMTWDDRMFQIYGMDAPPSKYGVAVWEDALHPEDREYAKESVEAAINDDREYNIEFRIVRPNGDVRMVRARGQVLRDSAGRPSRMIGVNADITNIKRLEETMRRMEKMDAIGQLAGGVAHDFNNQLTGIMGYASILQTMASDPRQLVVIDNILTSAQRSADLTRQLLNVARKATPRMLPVDIHSIIGEVVAILKHSIDKRIIIQQTLNAEPSIIDGDPSLLQTALLNLAINACDAMPDGGCLEFRTMPYEPQPEERPFLFDMPAGPCLCVSVSDTGTGIRESIREKIFDPFFTTKGQGKGIGLGLSVVYGTVQSHHGAIDLISKPGDGTTFRLLFPLGTLESQPATVRSARRPSTPATILIVDDEDPIRLTLSFILRQAGYTVISAADGVEGIEKYQSAADSIALVILDLNMPRMNGRDVFFRLRSIQPEVKILVSSGYSSENVEDLLQLRRCGYISKPYHKDELLDAIAEMLER